MLDPSTQPFAVLADIHGNSFALRAVLADMHSRGITNAINLGDVYYGPLDPAGTAELLSLFSMPTVCGNQDRLLWEGDRDALPTLGSVLDALPEPAFEALRSAPLELRLPGGVYACHGAPGDDCKYLLENVEQGHPRLNPLSDISGIVPKDVSLVLCGHTHFARVVHVGDTVVMNPGSVGLPAYTDDDPPHAMQAGSPHARYMIVKNVSGSWVCEPVCVAYNWEAAANLAAERGRDDWAMWLRTGRATIS